MDSQQFLSDADPELGSDEDEQLDVQVDDDENFQEKRAEKEPEHMEQEEVVDEQGSDDGDDDDDDSSASEIKPVRYGGRSEYEERYLSVAKVYDEDDDEDDENNASLSESGAAADDIEGGQLQQQQQQLQWNDDDDGEELDDDNYSYITPHRPDVTTKLHPLPSQQQRLQEPDGLSWRSDGGVSHGKTAALDLEELPPDRRPSWCYANPQERLRRRQLMLEQESSSRRENQSSTQCSMPAKKQTQLLPQQQHPRATMLRSRCAPSAEDEKNLNEFCRRTLIEEEAAKRKMSGERKRGDDDCDDDVDDRPQRLGQQRQLRTIDDDYDSDFEDPNHSRQRQRREMNPSPKPAASSASRARNNSNTVPPTPVDGDHRYISLKELADLGVVSRDAVAAQAAVDRARSGNVHQQLSISSRSGGGIAASASPWTAVEPWHLRDEAQIDARSSNPQTSSTSDAVAKSVAAPPLAFSAAGGSWHERMKCEMKQDV